MENEKFQQEKSVSSGLTNFLNLDGGAMNKHEKEILEHAQISKENKPFSEFKSWLVGFRAGTEKEESNELKRELDKLVEG